MITFPINISYININNQAHKDKNMLISIEHNQQFNPSIIGCPALLFICQAIGKEDAIPRIMHSHEDRLEIMLIYKGKGNYIIDGQFYSVKEGDLLVFNSDVIHEEQPLPNQELIIYSCGISCLQMQSLPENHIVSNKQIPVVNAIIHAEILKSFFESMITFSTQNTHESHEIIHYNVINLILFVRQIFIEREQHLYSKKMSLGQRIKDFLDQHYLDSVDLDTISEALNVNRYYLSHVFKAFSGYAPKQYIIRRRMGEAQSLLVSTNYSIAKIASQVGYSNVNNFHCIFEKVVGMPPGKYKRQWLNKI